MSDMKNASRPGKYWNQYSHRRQEAPSGRLRLRVDETVHPSRRANFSSGDESCKQTLSIRPYQEREGSPNSADGHYTEREDSGRGARVRRMGRYGRDGLKSVSNRIHRTPSYDPAYRRSSQSPSSEVDFVNTSVPDQGDLQYTRAREGRQRQHGSASEENEYEEVDKCSRRHYWGRMFERSRSLWGAGGTSIPRGSRRDSATNFNKVRDGQVNANIGSRSPAKMRLARSSPPTEGAPAHVARSSVDQSTRRSSLQNITSNKESSHKHDQGLLPTKSRDLSAEDGHQWAKTEVDSSRGRGRGGRNKGRDGGERKRGGSIKGRGRNGYH